MTSVSAAPAEGQGFAAARDAAVVCDLAPLAILAIDGHDAATFLQGQLSSDILGLSAEACEFTSWNSPAGRVLANMVIWRAGPNAADGFRAIISADLAAFVQKRLGMFVLRSRVTLSDATPGIARFGVGGPRAHEAVHAALGAAPAPFTVTRHGNVAVLGVHGPRYIVVAPAAEKAATQALLAGHAQPAPFEAWQWLTIRSGVPIITEATRDRFVPQMINWDVLGGVNFQKGCYTGQEIIARTQYLGRLKERLFAFTLPGGGAHPGDRLFGRAFADQPCGTVVNVAPAPQGGEDLLAVLQLAAAADGDVHLGAPDGPALAAVALPYAVPEPSAPRGRTA